MGYREVRTGRVCGNRNHVFVCYSSDPALNELEAEYCFNCGETIKADVCLGIFTAAGPSVLEETVSAFKSGAYARH